VKKNNFKKNKNIESFKNNNILGRVDLKKNIKKNINKFTMTTHEDSLLFNTNNSSIVYNNLYNYIIKLTSIRDNLVEKRFLNFVIKNKINKKKNSKYLNYIFFNRLSKEPSYQIKDYRDDYLTT
jgi:hypothetical protein